MSITATTNTISDSFSQPTTACNDRRARWFCIFSLVQLSVDLSWSRLNSDENESDKFCAWLEEKELKPIRRNRESMSEQVVDLVSLNFIHLNFMCKVLRSIVIVKRIFESICTAWSCLTTIKSRTVARNVKYYVCITSVTHICVPIVACAITTNSSYG